MMDNEDRQRKVQAGKEKFAELMRKKSGQDGTKKNKKKKVKKDETAGANDSLTTSSSVESSPTKSQPDVCHESFVGSTEENTDPRSSASEDVSAEITEPGSFISDEASTEEASKSDELPTGSQEDLLDFSHEDKHVDGAILENLHSTAGSSKYEILLPTGSQEDLLGVEDVILELDTSQQENILDSVTIKQQLFNNYSASDDPVSEENVQEEFGLKIILEEYKKKLSEYQVALSRRDEVIHQLSERLEVSLQTQDKDQAEAAQQAEALAQEISILRQQLVQAREILSRQKSSTGITPQQLLEAENSVLLLSQESSRKDALIKDLCGKLANANGQLEGIRAEMGQELLLCQRKLHSLEEHCMEVNGEENDSETITVDTQTDTWEMEDVSVTPSVCDSTPRLISSLLEHSGDSAAHKVIQQLELSMRLQEKLNNELRNLQNSVSQFTKDSSPDSGNIYCVPSVTNSYEYFETKLTVINSTMQGLLDCASNTDTDRSLGYVSECVNSPAVSPEVNFKYRTQFVKTLLLEELQHLKNIYSNHLDLQSDLDSLRRTFGALQSRVEISQGEQCVHSCNEFEQLKLLNEKLSIEMTDVMFERDQLKQLVSVIKESLNDATLLIHELRLENSNLLCETDRLNNDIHAAKDVLINSALGFREELSDPFAIEPCVQSLCNRLQKSELQCSELNVSVEQLVERNNILNKDVLDYKEKFENEKQEKEILEKKFQNSDNETSTKFLLSSLESSALNQPTNADCDLESKSCDNINNLQTQYEELLQEKMALELQLNDIQNNTVSLSNYQAAKQEIERLERAELRLCAILEENDSLQKRIDHLEHDLNELLQSNSQWKKETNEIEQDLMTKLIEMELSKGELEAQLQEKEMLLDSALSANTEYKCQLNTSLETLSSLRNGSDLVEIWDSHKAYLIELATLKQNLQVETEFKLTLQARVAYYKTKCEQLETLHAAVREQLQQIREQLQSVWNQQDGLRRELVENMLEKESFQKEIISLRNKLEFMVTDKEAESIHIQHVSLLGGGDSPEKRTPAHSERSSSIKEMFEQDSINSSFDYSDSLASESVDTEMRKQSTVDGGKVSVEPNSITEEVAGPVFAKDSTSEAHLQIALDLKDLYINDLQLQILEAKMEQNNHHCLQSLELQEKLLEQQRRQTEKNLAQIQEVFTVMDLYSCKNKENALKELKLLYDKKHVEEVLGIHNKYKKELENLILQSPLMSCNNNEDENVPSLKQQALQVLECQKRNHLLCVEQELRLENIRKLEETKAEFFDLQKNELILAKEKLESENQTLRAMFTEMDTKEFTERNTEECSVLLDKFITQLNTEITQHSLMVQSKWSRWFSETLNTKSSKIPKSLSYDSLGLNPVECLSQLTSEMKEKETWLQVSSAMQEAVQLYVEHLTGVKSEIENESIALLNLKEDILKSLNDQKFSIPINQNGDLRLLPPENSSVDMVDLCPVDLDEISSVSNACSGNCAFELQALQKEIVNLRDEISIAQNKHITELQAVEEKHLNEMEDILKKINDQQEAILVPSEAAIVEGSNLAAEINNNNNVSGDESTVEEKDLLKNLPEKHRSEIEKISEKHLSEIQKLEEAFRLQNEMTVYELCQKHSSEIQELKDKHLSETVKIREELETEKEKAVQRLTELHSSEMKEAADKHLLLTTVMQEELETMKNSLDNLTEKHAMEMNEIIKKHAAEITVLNENIAQKTLETDMNKVSMIHKQHEAEINNLQSQLKEHFEAEKSLLVCHYEAKLKDVLESHSLELENKAVMNKSVHESHNKELQNKIEELKAEHLQKEMDLKTQMHTIIEDHEVELKNLEEKYLQREQELRSKLQALNDNLKSQVNNLNEVSSLSSSWELKYNQLLPLYEGILEEVTNLKLRQEELEKEHQLETHNKLGELQTRMMSEQLAIVENAVSKCKEEMELLRNKCLNEEQGKFATDLNNQKREWKMRETQLNDEIVSIRNSHQEEIRQLKLKLKDKDEMKVLYGKLFAEQKELQNAFEHLKSETDKRAELQEQLSRMNLKLNHGGEELAALHLQHSKEINDVNEKFLIEVSEVKIQHEEKLRASLDEAKSTFEEDTTNLLHKHSKDIAVWEKRLNGLRQLLTVTLEKMLQTCIIIQGKNENEEVLLRESVGMVEAYVCELDILLQNELEASEPDVPAKLQQNMFLDLDNFLHEKLGVPPCDISFVGRLKEMKLQAEAKTKPTTTDASTSVDDIVYENDYKDTLAEVEKLRLEVQQNITDQDLENANLTEEIRLLTDQIAQLESQNVSLKHELTTVKTVSTRRSSRPPGRDWLAGTELSSVEFESWQVHAAQTNSRLLHVLSDLVKTFVDTEQHIQQCLARLGLSVFQTSDSGTINDEDGPSSGQFHHGSREDFGTLCQQSGEGGLTFEMCEDGLDLTPRAWDLFASAFKSQEVEPEDDVVIGASRRLRLAVDQVLSLLSELMELQSLQDLSILHQKNEELCAELKEEETAKMEAQAQSLKLEGELRNLDQACKSLKEKLEESEQQSHSLWQELEGARLRLGQLEVTHEGLAEEKRLLLEQSHLLASGLQDTEQRSNLGEEEICDHLLLGQSPELVAENTRLLGEKRTLQEKQEYEKQQISRRLHQVELALEEAIAQKEELQERLGREIADLKCQMEAMEKQLHSNKKFIEEQGHEREQEREEYSKEIRNLKESLREKDRTQIAEVSLCKEVESLELQLRSKSDLIMDACERRDELEGTVQQQKDKILDLQEVITELEKQLEEKVRSEKELKEQIEVIRAELSEQDRQQEELSEHLSELQESQMRKEQGQHIRELEEQLESRNQEIQHLQHYNTLIQEFRGQLHVLDERVESKCRQLERFHWVCALSPVPSEDTTSASDYRDPDKAILLIQEGGRVLSPASAHWEELRALENRIDTFLSSTEELIKRHRELENQFKLLRSNKEEVALERSILQEQLNDQLLQISTLKTRLEEKRFGSTFQGAKASVAIEMTQLREELQDVRARCDSMARMHQETKSRLSLAQQQLHERTEEVNSLQSQLLHAQAESDENGAIVHQLQDRLEEMKRTYEFKLDFDEPCPPKSVCDNFTQTGDGSSVAGSSPAAADIYQANWKSFRCESSVQVGTPFNQLDIIPEVDDDEVLSNQENLQSLKIKERIRAENQSLRRQNHSLEEQSQLQKDFNTLQVMVTEKDEELTSLSQDIEEQELLKHEIDHLHKSLTEKQEQQVAQKESLSVLQKEILSLQGNAKKTADEISCLKETLDSKSSQLESWRTAAQEHKLRADQLKQSLESLASEKASETKSAESVRLMLEREVNHLQTEASEWSARNQKELERRQQEINRLEAERDGLKQALESTSKKLQERETQAQKSRRAMELKALREQRVHQEELIKQMQEEYAEKQSEAQSQIQVLLAKLQAARESQDMEKSHHKESMKNLLIEHQKELQALVRDKDKDLEDNAQQVAALREEVQRLKLQLLSESQRSLLHLHSASRESTPDSDGTTMSSSCTSNGREDGLQLLPPHIQKLCSRLLKEGKEVLSLTEKEQKWCEVVSSKKGEQEEGDVEFAEEEGLKGNKIEQKDHGDSYSFKEVQCNLLSLPAAISETLLVAKDKLLEKSDWLQHLTVVDVVTSKQDVLELVKSLFSLEKKWLLEQIQDLLTYISSISEQNIASVLSPPVNTVQLLTKEWWNKRADLLTEKHSALIQQLILAIESSQERRFLQNPHGTPEIALLLEQLESCKWQIQKQKELLEYSQQHEESQRQEFQNHLEQEKINSNQLSSQLREWRKRCSQVETALSGKQSEVTKITQALDQTRRDLGHLRSDLDLEKFHGQQLLHALESERRNFHQVHAALYSERQRKDNTHRRDVQLIKHLKSVLHAHGLGDKVSPLSASLATSPVPDAMEPTEVFRNATSIYSMGNSLASFGIPAPESLECIKCSWREHQNSVFKKDDLGLPNTAAGDVTDGQQHPQMVIELLRLRRHKDSLCFQKRYLLRLLSNYQETEAASLSALSCTGVCTPPMATGDCLAVDSTKKSRLSFRVISITILSITRMRKMLEVLKELRARQGHTQERIVGGASGGGGVGGRQRWRQGLMNSQTTLMPSSWPSEEAPGALSFGSPSNGAMSPLYASASSPREKLIRTSSFASPLLTDLTFDSSSMKSVCSGKSEPEQRRINDRRFEECVERLEFLHERMGLNSS